MADETGQIYCSIKLYSHGHPVVLISTHVIFVGSLEITGVFKPWTDHNCWTQNKDKKGDLSISPNKVIEVAILSEEDLHDQALLLRVLYDNTNPIHSQKKGGSDIFQLP